MQVISPLFFTMYKPNVAICTANVIQHAFKCISKPLQGHI